MRLFTSRFANRGLRTRPDLVKVSIAVSGPRWQVGYNWERLLPLAPSGIRHIKDEGEYRTAYLARLDQLGLDYISHALQVISKAHRGKDLVLVCYEDLRKPELRCHRAMFAEWWLRQTGELVLELETDLGPPVPPEQMGLC